MKEYVPRPLLAYVSAGFPSIADEYIETTLDLNELLIEHPAATFFVRVSGDSMVQAGIYDNDIVIVDRSLTPVHNKIVIARIDDEFTVKRLDLSVQGNVILQPANPAYKPCVLSRERDFAIWGVVTCVLHRV